MAMVPSNEAKRIMSEVITKLHSPMAYVAAVSENQADVIMLAWSSGAMSSCDMTNKPIDYHVSKMGLWGDALRKKKIFITNDYPNCKEPSKHGYPAGHVTVKRHMNGPVMNKGKVVAIIGVGNGSKEYTADDEKVFSAYLQSLSDKMAEVRDAAFKKV